MCCLRKRFNQMSLPKDQLMNKNVVNLTVAILMSLGITACSSGGGENVGISQAEYTGQQAAESLATYKTESDAALTSLNDAIATLKEALAEVQAATTASVANAALLKAQTALATAKSAASTINNAGENASGLASKASSYSSTATSDAAYLESLVSQAEALLSQATALTTEVETKATEIAVAEEAEKLKEAQYQANVATVKNYSNSYFANDSSAIYKYLTDETEKAKLIATINSQSNISDGTCASTNTSKTQGACSTALEKGTVLGSYKQSYSSYAAIREDYNKDIENVPSNSYVYMVSTPTLDKNAVVDATYKGQVSYSYRNRPAITTIDGLTLNVKDATISGNVVETTVSGSGKVTNTTVMTFNDGAISASDEKVAFSGDVTFHYGSRAFNTSTKADFNGTYKGQFAGANAEEVVGTFESTGTTDDTSVQGAFAASK